MLSTRTRHVITDSFPMDVVAAHEDPPSEESGPALDPASFLHTFPMGFVYKEQTTRQLCDQADARLTTDPARVRHWVGEARPSQ